MSVLPMPTGAPDHDPELVLAFGTLRHASFADRVEAAASAGFGAIGLTVGEYDRVRREGLSDADMSTTLDDHGVRLVELESITGFAAASGPADVPLRPGMLYADPDVEARAFAIADAFGSRHLQAVGVFRNQPLAPNVVEAFGALCDRAAEHGLLVALEFVPYTDIPDVATASRIVIEADRPNGGLCADSWHFFRGTADYNDLSRIPGDKVFMIQLNDGSRVPTDPVLMNEAVHNRLCPGEGDFDLKSFLQALWTAGADAPISVEVYSDELNSLPARQAAARAAAGTRHVLAAARRNSGARNERDSTH